MDRLTPKEWEVCSLLNTFNQLRSFKLDPVEILEWKDTILRIRPDLEPVHLQMCIDGMITGQIPYDQTKGIKNIFDGLARVINEDGKWKILKPVF